MKVQYFLHLLLVLSLYIVPHVQAEGEFRADYDVTYTVKENGYAGVIQKISLTNRMATIFPKQYSIILESDKIMNVTAHDSEGEIDTQIIKNNGKTQILVSFSKPIVGLGKKLPFELSYENPDIASHNGRIWEVNIPAISDTKDIGSYTVTLNVPPSFGSPAYMSPPPDETGTWSKDLVAQGGVSIAYGSEQYFTVMATYILENKDRVTKRMEIAIPPDTAFQKVSISDINPKPISIDRDIDGNWLAQYDVKPQSTIEVTVSEIISVSINPRSEYGYETIDTKPYLNATKYWNPTFPEIMNVAQSVRSPRDIYNYLVRTMTYDYSRVSTSPIRKGSAQALAEPKYSICSDFTDLFIAIARASGIPARQAVGYAYTTNSRLRPLSLISDVLHAWPEYYDETRKIWIPIDPTWASTTGGSDYFSKLDFNHIVFVINGMKDDYPYPAGSYVSPSTKKKSVIVEFSDKPEVVHPVGKISLSLTFPKTVLAGLSTMGTFTVTNDFGIGMNAISYALTSSPERLMKRESIEHLPPFTEKTVSFVYPSGNIFESGKRTITVAIADGKASVDFNVIPLFAVMGVIGLLGIISIFFIWIKRKHMS